MIARALIWLLTVLGFVTLLPTPARAGSDIGASGYWELASDLGFDADAQFPVTVSAWVCPDSTTGTDTVFAIEDKGDQNRASIHLSSGTLRSEVSGAAGAGPSVQTASKTSTGGRWYHVVAVLDDTQALTFVWVDGSFIGGGSGTTRALADLDTTTLGCNWSGASAAQNFFDGVITDVAVWSVALTEEEVQGLTKGQKPCNVRPSSLVLWCPPESMNGTVCYDVVGGRSFTKNGTITDSSDNGPGGFTPPGLGSWTPASLTGLALWLKGDAGVTGSAPVTAWADQSGAGNDLDNTGTGAPAATSDGYGGRGGVAFTSDSLYGEPAPVTATPFYGLAVINPTGITASDSVFNLVDKDSDAESWQLRVTSGVVGEWVGNSTAGGADAANTTGPLLSSYTRAISMEFDEASTTSRRVSVNGGQQGTNTGSSEPLLMDRYSIGRKEDATPDAINVATTLYELVLVTSAPTNAERCLWFRYARSRWGVRGGPWRYE